MHEIFLCLRSVSVLVASWSARLCSRYQRLVTTARALELLELMPMDTLGEFWLWVELGL